MTTFTDFILRNFEPAVAVAIAIIMTLQAKLSHEDDWVESYKFVFAKWLDPFVSAAGRPLIRKKTDEDYITTAKIGEVYLEEVLDKKYDRQILSTKKYREINGSTQWSDGSWAYQYPHSDKQHHVYYFVGDDGIDISGHKEWSTMIPSKHHSGEQEHGDPDGILVGLLEENKVVNNFDGDKTW